MPESTTSRLSDADFWDELIGCLPRLRRRAARYVHDAAGIDVDDVVHDVVERAWLHRDRIEPGKVLAWCSTAARLRVGEILHRGEHAHHVPVANMEAACDASGDTSPDPADVVWSGEVVAAVRAALQDLPDHYRNVIEASAYRELDQAAIAAAHSMTVPQVNMIQFRAREKLRRALRSVHLSALPALLLRPFRAVRRALGPTQLPGPAFAAGAAVVVTLSAVLQYTMPLGPTPAEASTSPTLPRIAAAPVVDERGRPTSLTPTPGDAVARPGVTPEPRNSPSALVPTPSPCAVTCLVPPVPTPPTNTENGDQITVNTPAELEDYSGPVGVREGYAPVCDRWVDNPAARCTRHGRPDWVVPPTHRPAHTV